MIRAIIFDCFGVLVTESWLAFKDEHFGHDEKQAAEATDLMQQADAGLISHEEFLAQVATMAGVSKAEVEASLDRNAPNEPLLHYVEVALRSDYKIGMLSNAAANWLNELFSKKQQALFDAVSLSYETGVTKPEERAYELAAQQLGMTVGECVFIDDQERHCTGAREAGMQAILYKNFETMRVELEKLLAEQGK